jgi:hypothetical protein
MVRSYDESNVAEINRMSTILLSVYDSSAGCQDMRHGVKQPGDTAVFTPTDHIRDAS